MVIDSLPHYLRFTENISTFKIALKLSFLRERLICISQMFYYSFHFSVIVFWYFAALYFSHVFKTIVQL